MELSLTSWRHERTAPRSRAVRSSPVSARFPCCRARAQLLLDELRKLPGRHVCFDADVECSEAEAALANRRIGIIAQHKNRNGPRGRLRAEPPQGLETIDSRQTIVQANEVWGGCCGRVEPLLAVMGNDDVVPGDLQTQPIHVGDACIVIDDEQAKTLSGRLSPPWLRRPFVIGIAAYRVIDNGSDGCHPRSS